MLTSTTIQNLTAIRIRSSKSFLEDSDGDLLSSTNNAELFLNYGLHSRFKISSSRLDCETLSDSLALAAIRPGDPLGFTPMLDALSQLRDGGKSRGLYARQVNHLHTLLRSGQSDKWYEFTHSPKDYEANTDRALADLRIGYVALHELHNTGETLAFSRLLGVMIHLLCSLALDNSGGRTPNEDFYRMAVRDE